MIGKSTYYNPIRILALDRLIKNKFKDSLKKWVNSHKPIGQNIQKDISDFIDKHNKTLIKNLFLEEEKGKTNNRKIQKGTNYFSIGRLYGYKEYFPTSSDDLSEPNIQGYINRFVSGDYKYKKTLSGYFYNEKLNPYILKFDYKDKEKLKFPTYISFRLPMLLEAALPGENIKAWEQFEKHSEAIKVMEIIHEELKEFDKDLQPFVTFCAIYYSRRKKKLHHFDLKFYELLHKKDAKGIDYWEGNAELLYNPKKGGRVELGGIANKKGDKLTVTLFSIDGTKRIVLFFQIRSELFLDQITTLHGVYAGDSLRAESQVIAREFIAVKQFLLEDDKSYLRIISAMLLKRHNFGVKPYDPTWDYFGRIFSTANSIDDSLIEIVSGISNYGLILLHYNSSETIMLSKIEVRNDLLELVFAIPEKELHSCHLSARGKGTKIIATTYSRDNLASVIVFDFKNTKSHIFDGTFTYLQEKDIHSSYLVGIITKENKFLEATKLNTIEEKELFKNKAIKYREGLKRLDYLKKINHKVD